MDAQDLSGRMIAAGRALAGDIWTQMERYAIPELKKIAIQIEAIARNAADYTPAGARALLDMQVRVIVAMTSLTLLAVQDAINAILDAVKGMVNGAVGLPLL